MANYYNTTGTGGYPACTSTLNQCPCSYSGCMDPNMQFYDPLATCDDGSCVGWVVGCMDPTAHNYSPTATQDDGSCIAKVFGCTDPNAFGFNPLANTDDGSCTPVVSGCSDPNAYNYNDQANTDCSGANWGTNIPTQGTQSSFSGYSSAAGKQRVKVGPPGRGYYSRAISATVGPSRSSARGRLSWPPEPFRGSARMNEGWEVDGDIYRNGTGQGLATGSSGMTHPNALNYLPIEPQGRYYRTNAISATVGPSRSGEYNPDVPITNRADRDWDAVRGTDYARGSARMNGDDYDGDIYRNAYGGPRYHPTAGRTGSSISATVGPSRGSARMNEGWEVDGDIYRNGTGQGLATGSSGRYGAYERDVPVDSRAISQEWNWPY